jgi:hypothetical protein
MADLAENDLGRPDLVDTMTTLLDEIERNYDKMLADDTLNEAFRRYGPLVERLMNVAYEGWQTVEAQLAQLRRPPSS